MYKKTIMIAAILTIFIILASLTYFILFYSDNQIRTEDLTKSYSTLSIHEVYDLLYNKSKDIIVVDVPSTGLSRYEEAHLEGALLIHDEDHFPKGIKSLYYSEKDILIYDDFDDLGDEFGVYYCEQLVNHTYGNIFYMDGGLTTWIDYGYPYWSERS